MTSGRSAVRRMRSRTSSKTTGLEVRSVVSACPYGAAMPRSAAVLPTVDGCGVAVAGVVGDVVDTDSADDEVVMMPASTTALSGSEEGV
jgi:hypothetical protein